jgi:cysteine synthase
LGTGGSIPGIGSLERSVIDIMKIVPSTPAEIMYLPSGESKILEISPMWSLILLRGTPKVG